MPIDASQHRIAIVTGGASGIGRAPSEQLANSGAGVMIADIDGSGAEQVAASIRHRGAQAEAAPVDVANPALIEELVQDTTAKHGRLDFMFNNAAVAAVGELRDGNLEDFRRVVEVNVFPFSAAVAWRLYRICPAAFNPLWRHTLKGFRVLRLKP